MIIKIPEKSQKKKVKYVCEKCDFISSNRKDYNKHVLTRKHKKTQKEQSQCLNIDFYCNYCGKIYKHRSGLSRHKNKCTKKPDFFCGKLPFVTLIDKKYPHLKKDTTLSECEEISLKELLVKQTETIELLKIILKKEVT